MTQEVQEFLSFISTEKGLSENTKLAYERDLGQFATFCKVRKLDWARLTTQQLRQFLAHLRNHELSPRSIARKLSAIKQFYGFLLRENRVSEDPTELLSIHLKPRKLPKCLTVEEVVRLLEAASGKNEMEIRDRAFLELGYATGARISELVELTVDRLDLDEGFVKFHGKGGRERLVPVNRVALEWCRRYREIRHEWLRLTNLRETHVLFLTRLGKAFTRQGVWRLIKIYARRADLDKKVWPHMIRHSFATHVLQGGADLRAVQELLGHRSISTTEIYTHLDIENLKVMQLKYHPRG